MEWNKYRIVEVPSVKGTLFQPQFKKRFWFGKYKDVSFDFCGEYVNDVFNIRKHTPISDNEDIAKSNIEVFRDFLKARPFKYKGRTVSPILVKVPNGGAADFEIILYEPDTYVFISNRSCYARTYTGLDNFKYTVDIEEHYEK